MPEHIINLVERAYFMCCFTDLASAFHVYDHVTKQSISSHHGISNTYWTGFAHIKKRLFQDNSVYQTNNTGT